MVYSFNNDPIADLLLLINYIQVRNDHDRIWNEKSKREEVPMISFPIFVRPNWSTSVNIKPLKMLQSCGKNLYHRMFIIVINLIPNLQLTILIAIQQFLGTDKIVNYQLP